MDARSEYREAAARGASPVRLVVTLYEQAIQDLTRAAAAMKLGEIEVRTRAINHALTVLGHLQGTLNRERGGEVARDLDRFYNCMRAQLMEAQFLMSSEILQQQISHLLSLRDAWIQVDYATTESRSGPPVELGGDAVTLGAVQADSSDWKA